MPRDLESMLTPSDRAELRAFHIGLTALKPAVDPPSPRPVVSMEMYCAVVDSNEKITQENYELRQQKKRLMRVSRHYMLLSWRWFLIAIGLAAIAGAFAVRIWIGR